MAFNEIPKIRWRVVSVSGTSISGSAVISSMPSTVDLAVGMVVEHASFPVGTTILSILGPTSVQCSASALTSTVATRTFYHEFSFRFPPSDDDGEEINIQDRRSTAISGARQVSVDFIEHKRQLKFSFLTAQEVTDLKFFWTDWAYLGKAFRYFEDKNGVNFINYEADTLDFKPTKVTPTLYAVPFKFRRIE
jgi:hypothetical protein